MPKPTAKLSTFLPPIIFGTTTFNYQFNANPYALGPTEIVQRAFAHGIRAFDSSPYYGPAEEILGEALASDLIRTNYPRHQYYILTKIGRIAADSFDYSPSWIRYSVKRSCQRLRTNYLDVVYCHDVEFVSAAEVLIAIKELRRIRDAEGTIKYVGISGYPLHVLCDLAEMIQRETGEPLDAVMSYSHFNLQNTRLLSKGLPRLAAAGVDVVPNGSPLSMGLLRRQGPPVGSIGDWHPAPDGLREACAAASRWVDRQGEKLEEVAVRFAMENWLHEATRVGTLGNPHLDGVSRSPNKKLGVSVMGVSKIEELDGTMRVFRSILDGSADSEAEPKQRPPTPGEVTTSDREWSIQRRQQVRILAEGVRRVLGDWADFTWESPGKGFVNQPHPGPMDASAEIFLQEYVKEPLVTVAMVTPPSDPDDGLLEEIPAISC